MLCEQRITRFNNGTGKPPLSTCNSNPCLNNGMCMMVLNRVHCACPPGFDGSRCERIANKTKNTACSHSSQNCKNGATCVDNGSYTTYACKCTSGFVGKYCTSFASDPCYLKNYCHSAGKCVLSGNDYYCKCRKGYEGRLCDIRRTNLCEVNPCENEGICYQRKNRLTRESEAICICRDKWSGRTCSEDHSEPCKSNPCINNGECRDLTNGKYLCKCPKGFFGESCELKDPCEDETCNGNGFCLPKVMRMNETFSLSTQCLCHKYYAGRQCEFVNPCLNDNPCLNGGQCKSKPIYAFPNMFTVVGFEKATCDCTEYFAGKHCADLSPCVTNNPCENEGYCNDTYIYKTTENGYENTFGDPNCTCPLDYEGIHCKTRINNPCEELPCENGGTCIRRKEDKNKYECLCDSKHEGENCELKKARYELTSCDFEKLCEDFKYWTNNRYHWKDRIGTTPSYMTGPSKAYEGIRYSYAEASSPATTGNIASIRSSYININGPSCISLYYHMFGSGIGKLKVYVQKKSGKILGNVWSKTGPQGNQWHHMQMDIANTTSGILIIEGTRGPSWSGDIAIDNIKWNFGTCLSETEVKP
ncbi:DgyrCDS3243 [Dimorphilus gyrociliatus]|uniref:DgyrCDS3243 n=1 Tax=Dimorphilus gyrociliatus TaxID=2664684 RepID=A0A7I8VFN1_9ANNE|nr:DgyrCDS3243 [Dimorphilus gyrociliatus]